MRLNRAGEIDYYEELGVDRNAAPEEIRDSFRSLVRLLHPDHQRDENLKAIAEQQLRKVNRIYAVLSDPDRRRRYDISLDGEMRPPTIVFTPASNIQAKELITRFVWIGAALLAVALIIWLATDPPSTQVVSVPPVAAQEHPASARPPANPEPAPAVVAPENTPVASVPTDSQDEIAQLRTALRNARNERDEARQALADLKEQQEAALHTQAPAPASSSLTSAPTTLTDIAPPRLNPAVARPAAAAVNATNNRNVRPSASEGRQFAGFWFFARSPQGNRNKSLYYPEFIEAILTEQNGVVHGRYRSRYQIVDRAISPDVNFEFAGTPNGGTIVCSWSGAGGARGQLTLHLTDENDLKVDWSASDVGSIQGLASGTATLTRRIE